MTEPSSPGSITGSHVYADDGIYNASVTIVDDADPTATDTETFDVDVRNVAPSVDAGPDRTIPLDNPVFNLQASFTDPGDDDIHTATINWGDESPTEPGVVTALGSGTVTGTHTYDAVEDTHVVTVTVTDDDGADDVATMLVTVSAEQPDDWVGTIQADPIPGLPGGLTPLQFGVRPGCTTGYETAGPCDSPRLTILTEDFIPSFYHPTYPAPSGGVDPQNLLQSRTVNSDSSPQTEWPLRLLLTGAGVGDTIPIGFTYTKSQIQTIVDLGTDPRQVVLLEGAPGSSGAVLVDFVAGTGESGGWACTDGGTTVNCTNSYTAQVVPDAGITFDFTIRVSETAVTTAVIAIDPAPYNEGSVIGFSGANSIPGAGTTINSYEWDFGDSSGFGPSGSPAATHAFGDDGPFNVMLTVGDTGGGSDSETQQITVNNVNPVVAPLGDLTINEGGTTNVSGSFTDAGTLDTFPQGFCDTGGPPGSAFITPTQTGPGAGTFDCPTFTYPDNAGSPFQAEVFIDDDDSGFGNAQFNVNVNNLPPVVNAGLDFSIPEGNTAGLPPFDPNFTFTDPGVQDAPFTATIDWDGSLGPLPPEAGTVVESGGSGSVDGTHFYQDDGIFDVEVCVTDKDGATGCDTVRVTVTNLDPLFDSGAIFFNPDPVDEGQSTSLEPFSTLFFDQGDLDTHTATIDWGDGSPVEPGAVSPAGSGAFQVDGTHPYVDNGPGSYIVEVCVTDDDGGTDCISGQVTVNNVAPTVDAGQDQIVISGEEVSLDPATFDDPAKGFDAPYQRVIDWGDGQTDFGGGDDPENPPGTAPGTVTGSHTYAADAIYTVTVTDKDGDTGDDTVQVVVGAAGVSCSSHRHSRTLASCHRHHHPVTLPWC